MVVIREPVLDGAAEQRLIARGGHLLDVRQAGRIAIGRLTHAEGARLGGHHPAETRFVAAERLADDHGDIVGGLGDDGADRGFHLDGFTGLETELGRRLRGGVRRYRQFVVEFDLAGFQPLEKQIERHDLGERGRMADSVGVGRLHHRAGIGIDDDRGLRGFVSGGRLGPAAPGAGIGVAGDRDEENDRRQAEGTATNPASDMASSTRHLRSSNPSNERFVRPHSWPIYSALMRQN